MQQMCLLKWSKWKLTSAADGGVLKRTEKGVSWLGRKEEDLTAGQASRRRRAHKKYSKIGILSNPLADTDIRIPMQYVCVCVCVICELCVKFNASVTKWRAATTAPEFRRNDNSSASRASFPHFPFSTSDLPASCRVLLLLLVHFADLIKMYDFSSFDELKYNFSTRCVAALQELRCNCNFLAVPEILTFL